MPDTGPIVLIEGLTKRLRCLTVLDGVDLRVEQGQVVGLAGPNGAGKSVTLKILLGLVRPTSGRVEIFGEKARPGAAALARVGALVDGPGFAPHLSGVDNLRLAALTAGRSVTADDIDKAVLLSGLGDAIRRKYHTYSHGMRYRLGLAQALLGDPELLLLDEPTTGLDPVQVSEIRRAIGETAAHGTTILVSSHQMAEVEQICSHAAIMDRGRVLAFGDVADLTGKRDGASPERTLEQVYLEKVASR